MNQGQPLVAASAPASAPAPAHRDRSPGGPALVQIRDLKTHFPIKAGLLRRVVGNVHAVDDVSFEIRRGEVYGLVGESGCGKTTLGRTLLRLEKATAGSASFNGEEIFAAHGKDLKRLRRRMQVIFQDPMSSLNPRMPVSDLIAEGLLAQADRENGWADRTTRDKQVGDALEAVKLRRDYSRRYPHEFSGGQRQRIGIARALALKPEFIFADEPVSALDVSIQSQILNLLAELREEFNLTYLFVAHNLSVIRYLSDRVGVMYLGKLVEEGDVGDLYSRPRHPYTVALLSAVPEPDPRIKKKRIILTGDVPSPVAPPSGCRFHTRCWLREQLDDPENCETVVPELRIMGAGHRVACHWAEKIEDSVVASALPSLPVALTGPVAQPAVPVPPASPPASAMLGPDASGSSTSLG